MLVLSEAHLRTTLTEYQAHYNYARPHQGTAQRVPDDERHAPWLLREFCIVVTQGGG
jgi:transposase InsO family protein